MAILGVDDFKSKLRGGGARPNLFKATINFPAYAGGDVELTSFLCEAAQLPGSTLGTIIVPFRGRQLKMAGDRTFDDAWTTTFLNDTDFGIRNSLELWMNGINNLATAEGVVALTDYQSDLTVEQLDRDDTVLKSYIFRNAWPIGLGQIDLTAEGADAIETFDCTWRYQHFEASGINF